MTVTAPSVGVLAVAGLLLVSLPAAATSSVPITEALDWRFLGVLSGFGALGSLARLLNTTDHSIPLDRSHVGQFLAGIVAATVVGLLLADLEWFTSAPRTIVGLALLAGWVGTSLLDQLGVLLSRRAARYLGGEGGDNDGE